MSAVVQPRLATSATLAVGLPELDDLVIPRARLERRLESGPNALTIVQAPTGTGKTLGVARWASRTRSVDRILWLDAGHLSADRKAQDRVVFSGRLCAGLSALGMTAPSDHPGTDAEEARWNDWFRAVGEALERDGRTTMIVLDDYPIGPSGWLGRRSAALLDLTTTLRLVIISAGPPAIDRCIGASLACAEVGERELEMGREEIAELLDRGGLAADDAVVERVFALTSGWAHGVGLASRAMAVGAEPDAALRGLESAVDDVVDREVLAQLPVEGRELVLRTSMSATVPVGLARAVVGDEIGDPSSWISRSHGFVALAEDGSWRCHPLLRRAARRRLDRDWPALSRTDRRVASRWHIDHGDRTTGLAIAADARDRAWLGEALLRSVAVPSILIGAPDDVVRRALSQLDLTDDQPLISAAVAVAAGNTDAGDAALQPYRSAIPAEASAGDVRRFSEVVIRIAIARQRSEAGEGLRWMKPARGIAAESLGSGRRFPAEAALFLAAHEAAFLAAEGEIDRAVTVLSAVVDAAPGSTAAEVARGECLGLLSFLEAVDGDLTSAARHAAAVPATASSDGNGVGVGYASLGSAWVHLERGELTQAQHLLASAIQVEGFGGDPWLAAAQRLATARLATLRGDPDVALRLLTALQRTRPPARSGWLADRVTVALAEAHLVAGDPNLALSVLTPEPRQSRVAARAAAAAARRAVGDRRGARALLAEVSAAATDAPLPEAVQIWILEAQLASEADDAERAVALALRALRAADREQLRSAFSLSTPWLIGFARRHVEHFRPYRTFLATLPNCGRAPNVDVVTTSAAVLDPLTDRELQILEQIADLRTTDQIATELFISANTVKTHTKSLFIKMSVNRRADAVRRGRDLGLC